ncbi:DUF4349 domain-containing protein [Mucilaginibacter terrenus]|uniref:DUF4349 domain-containing protein n=1 Tax=Mucilaginibacter terrenus TaxID=2482727 RepID=A0A3E2NL52_9SPHI|nr:DUF4349 domain-containing protein [Mucilaginibacter terrenus]RFZ81640.1 DUF4349 domain-containing protein [Mucilaginibacter terrenus]
MKTRTLILLGSIALLAACQGKHGDYEMANTDKRAFDSATADTAAADSAAIAKLVKTADISFKVKNVQQTGDTISALTARIGGMVMHHQMTSSVNNSEDIHVSGDSLMRVSAFSTSADMTVKVPSARLQEFMTKISHMGLYVTRRQMDIEDKSLDYLSTKLKLQSRKELVAQQKSGKVTIKDPQKVLWLKDDMTDGQIENQQIDQNVRYSNVSLAFFQSNTILKEMIANDDPSAYQLPFFKRLLMALANGWTIFVELILGLAYLWVLILAGVGLWIGYKTYKKNYPSPVSKSI